MAVNMKSMLMLLVISFVHYDCVKCEDVSEQGYVNGKKHFQQDLLYNSEYMFPSDRRAFKHNNTFVGFTAYTLSTQEVIADDTLVFDGILLNEGGAYQPSLGRFTCPVSGVYFISVTFKRFELNIFNLYVNRGSQHVLFSYGGSSSPNPNNMVSNNCIVRCSEGEYISVTANGNSVVYGETGVPQTTFSVVLLHQDVADQKLHESFIGFSATKTDGEQTYLAGDTISFDNVLLNDDGHYTAELSHFRCPADGVYYIMFNVYKNVQANLHLGIEKETVIVLHTEDTQNINNYNTLSNSRLVQCVQGELIMVKGTGIGEVRGVSSTYPVSSFSVMLMYNEGSAKHSSFVGFSAWKSTNQIYNNTNEIIIFDGITVNIGDHYQPILSRFVCPFDGIYYISVTFAKFDINPLQLEVRRDTLSFLRLVDSQVENPWNTVSNSALIRCFEGQSISVRAMGSGAIHGDPSKAMSTFTVMMMVQD